MSLVSRIGYLASYMSLMLFVLASTQTSFGRPDVGLWFLTGVLFLIGFPLLMSDPLPRKLKWRMLWASSPSGTVGCACSMYGIVTLYTISLPQMVKGEPLESWWLYLMTSMGALVFGSVMLVVRPPLVYARGKQPETDST